MKKLILLVLFINLISCKGDINVIRITSNNMPIAIVHTPSFWCIDGILVFSSAFSSKQVVGLDNKIVTCEPIIE